MPALHPAIASAVVVAGDQSPGVASGKSLVPMAAFMAERHSMMRLQPAQDGTLKEKLEHYRKGDTLELPPLLRQRQVAHGLTVDTGGKTPDHG